VRKYHSFVQWQYFIAEVADVMIRNSIVMNPMLLVYSYKGCDGCRKALKWLGEKGIEFENRAIRETPPSRAELKRMLKHYDGNLRRLFNVSGQDYRSLNLKERLPTMSEDEAFDLLSGNGNLVKRPFALGENSGAVGFKPDEWEDRLGL